MFFYLYCFNTFETDAENKLINNFQQTVLATGGWIWSPVLCYCPFLLNLSRSTVHRIEYIA